MAAAMATYFMGGTIEQIEYAAESAMEHLGMTCDPVGGYVIIPYENAICAVKALNTAVFCLSTDGSHTISFDEVVKTMKETREDFLFNLQRNL